MDCRYTLRVNSELTFRRQRTRMIYSSRGRMQSIARPSSFGSCGARTTHIIRIRSRAHNHVCAQVCAPHTFHTPQPQTAARPHTRDTLRNTRDLARDLAAAVRSTRALCAPSANRSYLLHHAPHGQHTTLRVAPQRRSRERERHHQMYVLLQHSTTRDDLAHATAPACTATAIGITAATTIARPLSLSLSLSLSRLCNSRKGRLRLRGAASSCCPCPSTSARPWCAQCPR